MSIATRPNGERLGWLLNVLVVMFPVAIVAMFVLFVWFGLAAAGEANPVSGNAILAIGGLVAIVDACFLVYGFANR